MVAKQDVKGEVVVHRVVEEFLSLIRYQFSGGGKSEK